MKTVGYSLSGLGALLILVSFLYDAAPEGTYNMGLLQFQMMVLTVGGVSALAGTIFTAVALVLNRMEVAGLLPPAGTRPVVSGSEVHGDL